MLRLLALALGGAASAAALGGGATTRPVDRVIGHWNEAGGVNGTYPSALPTIDWV